MSEPIRSTRQALRTCLPSVALLASLAATAAAQIPIDLRTWTAESYPSLSGTSTPNWNVAADGATVTQTSNSQPALFYSPFDIVDSRVEGRLRITGSSDDDFVGFAIGFRPGDTTNPSADYLLIDWKGATQSYNFGSPSCTPGSTALRGLAVSRVRGMPTADELWGHVNLDTPPCSGPNDRVDELARGQVRGSSAWSRNVDFTFALDFTPSQLDVYVDGQLEASVTGTFQVGRMAFYNFSQAGVVYSAFSVSCTASAANYGAGYPGTSGVPTLTSTLPTLGVRIDITGSNVAGVATAGVLIYGFEPADLPSGFGGRILVDPVVSEGHPVPLSGLAHRLIVPADPAFCGRSVYLQQAQVDSGATHSIAFSPGLWLRLGS